MFTDGTQHAVARGYLFNMAARLFCAGLHNVSMCSVLKFLFEKENCYRGGIVLLSHMFSSNRCQSNTKQLCQSARFLLTQRSAL